MKMMKVLAVPGVAVLDYAFGKAHGRFRLVGRKLVSLTEQQLREAAAAGSERYVGLSGEHALPLELQDCDIVRERDPVEPGDVYYVEAWPMRTEPTLVPAMGEAGTYFQRRVREGGLIAADEETAKLCGVPFAPQKGGE